MSTRQSPDVRKRPLLVGEELTCSPPPLPPPPAATHRVFLVADQAYKLQRAVWLVCFSLSPCQHCDVPVPNSQPPRLTITSSHCSRCRYPFMDMYSLERRRICCERECRMNQRTAPEIYLEVGARPDAGCVARWGFAALTTEDPGPSSPIGCQVVPIVPSGDEDGGLRLGGDPAKAVDFVVKMRRFDAVCSNSWASHCCFPFLTSRTRRTARSMTSWGQSG